MTRRLSLRWPDPRPFVARGDRPIRILAASDEPDRALEHEANRAALAPLDAIVGCGDLEPHWLAFLADAYRAPLVYVRGNHDRGGAWEESEPPVPQPALPGTDEHVAGISVAALEWPGVREPGNRRHPWLAWLQVASVARRVLVPRLVGRAEPVLVISHAPPIGAGDGPDAYHVGFAAYRWLLRRLRPPLWLHGHTTTATVQALRCDVDGTTLVNVTGTVLVELIAPNAPASADEGSDRSEDEGSGG